MSASRSRSRAAKDAATEVYAAPRTWDVEVSYAEIIQRAIDSEVERVAGPLAKALRYWMPDESLLEPRDIDGFNAAVEALATYEKRAGR